MCITIPPWHYSSHNYRESRTNERCPCIKWGSLPKKFCWKFNSSDLSNVEAVQFVWKLARKQTTQLAYLRMLTYFWILPILGSDFGTPVALSATKPIPVFQYLFVALCATYWSARRAIQTIWWRTDIFQNWLQKKISSIAQIFPNVRQCNGKTLTSYVANIGMYCATCLVNYCGDARQTRRGSQKWNAFMVHVQNLDWKNFNAALKML